MHVGFDLTPLSVPQSGVGTYTSNLFRHLALKKTDRITPLFHRPLHPQAQLPIWVRDHGQRRWAINKTIWMQLMLPAQLRREGVELAHFTNSVAPLAMKAPSVVTIHDMTLWLFPQHHYRRRLLAMRPLIPLVARRAAAIITVSHSAKSDIVRLLGVDEAKVHVVYEAPAADFRRLERNDERLQTMRRRYGLPDRFALYVGTIEPRKNLVRLIKAFAQFQECHDAPHHLLLVGSRGWKDTPVFQAIEQLALGDKVHFLDYVPFDDLIALYNLADALTFPSLYEGFGLPVVEAMACGTPVITSDSGSLVEVAGDAACVVNPLDVQSIAHGLGQVLLQRDYRADLRERGAAHVADFTWHRTAAETRQIYDMVVSAKKKETQPRLLQR